MDHWYQADVRGFTSHVDAGQTVQTNTAVTEDGHVTSEDRTSHLGEIALPQSAPHHIFTFRLYLNRGCTSGDEDVPFKFRIHFRFGLGVHRKTEEKAKKGKTNQLLLYVQSQRPGQLVDFPFPGAEASPPLLVQMSEINEESQKHEDQVDLQDVGEA